MNAFEQYLALHEIDAIKLSAAANVRYVTAYNAKKGIPIKPENARKIKEAVFQLTGVAYTGSFALPEEPPFVSQFPTIPLRKLRFQERGNTGNAK